MKGISALDRWESYENKINSCLLHQTFNNLHDEASISYVKYLKILYQGVDVSITITVNRSPGIWWMLICLHFLPEGITNCHGSKA